MHDKGLVDARVHLDGHESLSVHSLHLFPFFEFKIADDDDLVSIMWDDFWRYAAAVDRITTVTGLSIDDIAVNWESENMTSRTFRTFSDHKLLVAGVSL
jgi:hypothetical protein